jgi:hypothetical protein
VQPITRAALPCRAQVWGHVEIISSYCLMCLQDSLANSTCSYGPDLELLERLDRAGLLQVRGAAGACVRAGWLAPQCQAADDSKGPLDAACMPTAPQVMLDMIPKVKRHSQRCGYEVNILWMLANLRDHNIQVRLAAAQACGRPCLPLACPWTQLRARAGWLMRAA